jgi:hypothetical protein
MKTVLRIVVVALSDMLGTGYPICAREAACDCRAIGGRQSDRRRTVDHADPIFDDAKAGASVHDSLLWQPVKKMIGDNSITY